MIHTAKGGGGQEASWSCALRYTLVLAKPYNSGKLPVPCPRHPCAMPPAVAPPICLPRWPGRALAPESLLAARFIARIRSPSKRDAAAAGRSSEGMEVMHERNAHNFPLDLASVEAPSARKV
eukprot:365524-Chlamydomonas_euryale.AAC.6